MDNINERVAIMTIDISDNESYYRCCECNNVYRVTVYQRSNGTITLNAGACKCKGVRKYAITGINEQGRESRKE